MKRSAYPAGTLLPMAAYVAWLWLFPLFGLLQDSITTDGKELVCFNISFLAGLAGGFLITFIFTDSVTIGFIARWSAVVNILPTLFAAGGVWPPHTAGLSVLPALMGLSTAPFFAYWGASIAAAPRNKRGRYTGIMMACASALYAAVLLLSRYSPAGALLGSGMLLLLPALLSGKVISSVRNVHPAAGKNSLLPANSAIPTKNNQRPAAFWLPFILILFSLYSLSWVMFQTLFPLIREQDPLAPFLGIIAYGLVALCGGYYLDRAGEVENIALTGLVLLMIAFLAVPLFTLMGFFLPLPIFLEGGYGFIDLFIWVSLAFFVKQSRLDPVKCFSAGLLFNILFLISGMGLEPLIEKITQDSSLFVLSTLACIIVLAGVFPALALRKTRLFQGNNQSDTSQVSMNLPQLAGSIPAHFTAPEQLTPQEMKVLQLIVAGHDNTAIESTLHISRNTLKTHIRHIYSKAGVKSRFELLLKLRQPDPCSDANNQN